MPLDPRIWAVPPQYRRFPDEIADVYDAEDTSLLDVLELWQWKHDLATPPSMFGPAKPNERKMAARLGEEVADFLRIEEESKEAEKNARRELARDRLARIVKRHQSS